MNTKERKICTSGEQWKHCSSKKTAAKHSPQSGLVEGVVIYSAFRRYGQHHKGRLALGDEFLVAVRQVRTR